MKLLDLFSGAGGAARGYQQAGFYVVGIDNRPMPGYAGNEFIQADALEYVYLHGHEFDAIHASPPCQAFTSARAIHGEPHTDLLTPTRTALQHNGRPWIIENVPNAPMRADLILCGSMFGKPQLKRHRYFEFSWELPLILLPPCSHAKQLISVFGHGGHIYHSVEQWRKLMGIDWMTRDELAQAVPPAFTEFTGRFLMAHLMATTPLPQPNGNGASGNTTEHNAG